MAMPLELEVWSLGQESIGVVSGAELSAMIPQEIKHLVGCLGRVVNTNKSDPWTDFANTPYTALKADIPDTWNAIMEIPTTKSRHDVQYTYSGAHYESFEEYALKYSEWHGKIAATITSPNAPVKGSVAADKHREVIKTRVVKGVSVTLGTCSFITAPALVEKQATTEFQIDFEEWLKGQNLKESSVESCKKYLNDVLRGATHYISSVTLGASIYATRTVSQVNSSASGEIEAAVPHLPSATLQLGRSKSTSQIKQFNLKLGTIDEDAKIDMSDQAVIRYEFTPLTDLMSKDELRKDMTVAIQENMATVSEDERGPFHIKFHSPKGSKCYWKVDDDDTVEGTDTISEANHFHIHVDPDSKHCNGFYITTMSSKGTKLYLQFDKLDNTFTIRTQLVRGAEKSRFKMIDRVNPDCAVPIMSKITGNTGFIRDESYFIRPARSNSLVAMEDSLVCLRKFRSATATKNNLLMLFSLAETHDTAKERYHELVAQPQVRGIHTAV